MWSLDIMQVKLARDEVLGEEIRRMEVRRSNMLLAKVSSS